MGERGKNEEMKQRKSVNLDHAAPDADTAEPHDAAAKPAAPRKDVRLGREVQARIGQQLRAMYDDVVNQGVPTHIADLVRRLSEQE